MPGYKQFLCQEVLCTADSPEPADAKFNSIHEHTYTERKKCVYF